MKQVAFKRNAQKLTVKKTINVKPVQTIEEKIEEEFAREQNKAVAEFEKKFGTNHKGIYGRWFFYDMEMLQESIKKKYDDLENKKKNQRLYEK